MTRSPGIAEIGADLLEQMLAQGSWPARGLFDLQTIAGVERPIATAPR